MINTFLDNKGRPHIKATWSRPSKETAIVEFLVDTGGSRTSVTDENAKGLTMAGVMPIQGVMGGAVKRYLFEGGVIESEVRDPSGEIVERVQYSGPVLAMDDDILGTDVLGKWRLQVDFSVTPVQIRRPI